MENLTENLDEILASVHHLKEKFQHLKAKNQEMLGQINDLKVEVEQCKTENLKLKQTLEKRKERTLDSTDSAFNMISGADQKIGKMQLNPDQIKLQLDDFIEEIDQCIQIIQTK